MLQMFDIMVDLLFGFIFFENDYSILLTLVRKAKPVRSSDEGKFSKLNERYFESDKRKIKIPSVVLFEF